MGSLRSLRKTLGVKKPALPPKSEDPDLTNPRVYKKHVAGLEIERLQAEIESKRHTIKARKQPIFGLLMISTAFTILLFLRVPLGFDSTWVFSLACAIVGVGLYTALFVASLLVERREIATRETRIGYLEEKIKSL